MSKNNGGGTTDFGPGNRGQGYGGESKYDAANAKTVSNGGNDQMQGDGKVTEVTPKSLIGSGSAAIMK